MNSHHCWISGTRNSIAQVRARTLHHRSQSISTRRFINTTCVAFEGASDCSGYQCINVGRASFAWRRRETRSQSYGRSTTQPQSISRTGRKSTSLDIGRAKNGSSLTYRWWRNDGGGGNAKKNRKKCSVKTQKMVEAAGVEPASESTASKNSTCLSASYFSYPA